MSREADEGISETKALSCEQPYDVWPVYMVSCRAIYSSGLKIKGQAAGERLLGWLKTPGKLTNPDSPHPNAGPKANACCSPIIYIKYPLPRPCGCMHIFLLVHHLVVRDKLSRSEQTQSFSVEVDFLFWYDLFKKKQNPKHWVVFAVLSVWWFSLCGPSKKHWLCILKRWVTSCHPRKSF